MNDLFADHAKGSHGMAGLYFKYDTSALKVIVKQDQEGFMQFLIRISAIISGIIIITGFLNSLIQLVTDFFIRKISPQTYQQLHHQPSISSLPEKPQVQPHQPQPNNLISNANQMAEANFNFTVKQ